MNKDWTGNSNSIYKSLGASSHTDQDREENDYYATDPIAIDVLLGSEKFNVNIWEPACGEGHLSKRLKELGHNVYSTDLIDRGYCDEQLDFLSCTKNFDGDTRYYTLTLTLVLHTVHPCVRHHWLRHSKCGAR